MPATKKTRKPENKFVTIKHPKLKKHARCSERAFDEVWSKRGFEVVADADETEQPDLDDNGDDTSGESTGDKPSTPSSGGRKSTS